MAKGSKFTQDVQAILRKKGMLDPHARGATLENIMAANQRRRVEGRDPRGRKPKAPYPKIIGDSIFIRYLGKNHPTHIVLRAGMDPDVVEVAMELEIDKFIAVLNAKDREELSPEDKTLKEINDAYIAAKAGSSTFNANKMHRRYADHLAKLFPAERLSEILKGSGDAYIGEIINGVEDEEKRKTLHNSAVDRLRFQLKAIEYYYGNLTVEPEKKKNYDIQKKFKRHSEVTLTFEQLWRLLRGAEGWSYDLETGESSEDYDPDLEVVGKYSLLYFYHGGRSQVLLPLQWGVGFEGGCIDAKNGRIYRQPPGGDITNKRATPANLIGDLRDKVKVWERQDFENGWIHVLHDVSGGEITDMRPRFNRVKKKAGLEWMHPHDLKHTGVSLLGHAGLDISLIADAMSTNAETLKREYEHLNFLWPKNTGSGNCDVSMKRLAKTSPPDSDGWKLRSARWKKNKELQREKKKAKRREKAAAARLTVESQNAAA